jgi:GNAT superfamily N-acetyltransferase
MTPDKPLHIRKYRPSDRQAVRDICARTCWMGEYRPELIGDDWLWAEYWTRYFTDVECDLTWVVEKGTFYFSPLQGEHTGVLPKKVNVSMDSQMQRGKVECPLFAHVGQRGQAPTANDAVGASPLCGYLTGTADSSRFERYGLRLMPGIIWHVIRRRLMRQRQSRRAILQMARAMLSGDTDLPANLRRQYPATCHIDLLPDARQRGIGSTMLANFLRELARRGVPGVHAQTLSLNAAAGKSLARAGFTLALASPTTAFKLVHDGPVEVQTWTRGIDDCRFTIDN